MRTLSLPREIFEHIPGPAQVASEGNSFYLIERVDFEEGIRVWIHGAECHQRGMALAEALFAINLAKRLAVEGIRLATRPEFLPGVALMAIKPRKWRIKSLERILESFNSIVHKVISPYLLKPEYMIPTSREVRMLVASFLKHAGIQENIATNFAAIFSHIIEYDNAYRFRLLDIMSETSKNDLSNRPIGELLKLSRIVKERDHCNVGWKFRGMALILCVALCVPSIRKAFKSAVGEVDFARLQYDDNDRYWTAMRTDYPWWGQEAEERSKFNIGKKIPAPVPASAMEDIRKTI